MEEFIYLDVGCGEAKRNGCIGLDLRELKGVDIISDANKLPFRNNIFDGIFLIHIIEHIFDINLFMSDIWRVSKKDAIIKIWTPHYTSHNSYTDITHIHHLGSRSLDYFDKTTILGKYWISKTQFRILKRVLIFDKGMTNIWNYIIERLANKYYSRYEKTYGWIFPAKDIFFELKVRKKE